MRQLSVIIPTLQEAAGIAGTLQALQALRARGVEVIVVDGGSDDGTDRVAAPWADAVIVVGPQRRGRAAQLQAGALAAQGRVLLFLHADTALPPGADEAVLAAVASGHRWGRFDVRIEGRSRLLPVVARLMNLRSRLSGIATGDQAIFVTRDALDAIGGLPQQPLMEDVELCRRLLRLPGGGRPACLKARVQTSGRRWDEHGAWRTIFLMWRLRWRYWRGADPAELARHYAPHRLPVRSAD